MKFAVCAATMLLAVSACDDGVSRNAAAPPTRKVDYKARIDALAPKQRDALFLRAIRDAGHDCQQVLGSAYNGEQFEMPSWAARCSDARDWLIMLADDGRALVARREEKAAPAR